MKKNEQYIVIQDQKTDCYNKDEVMLIQKHIKNYKRFEKYFCDPFLMLGNQENLLGITERDFFKISDYKTIDPDGGTYEDLTADLSDLYNSFGTVFNLGTIEHIWDSHTAWSNSLKIVKPKGYFMGVSPVYGYYNHGIHITDPGFILSFIEKNNFILLDYYFTNIDGDEIENVEDAISRKKSTKNILLWYVAQKKSVIDKIQIPTQYYYNNKKIN
jgi:SAM-dependent methyltransferase